MNKKSTRVDLTPMVDLGFLLITFFVFTTTMSQATAMNLRMPDDKDPQKTDDICESCAITVLLGKNNSIYYYEGVGSDGIYKSTSYSASGIRNILVQKKKAVIKLRHADECTLIIKASAKSTFKNLIDLIDESNICQIKRYYIAEPNAMDRAKAE